MTDSNLVVPTDLKIEIEGLSRKEQRSEADVLRDALRQYVEQSVGIHWPRSIGMASDGSFDASRDEEYLAEHWIPFLLEECGLPPDFRSPDGTSSD